jgi:hypothetical protein
LGLSAQNAQITHPSFEDIELRKMPKNRTPIPPRSFAVPKEEEEAHNEMLKSLKNNIWGNGSSH